MIRRLTATALCRRGMFLLADLPSPHHPLSTSCPADLGNGGIFLLAELPLFTPPHAPSNPPLPVLLLQNAERYGVDAGRLDAVRVAASRSSPASEALEVAGRYADADSAALLVPEIAGLVRRGEREAGF